MQRFFSVFISIFFIFGVLFFVSFEGVKNPIDSLIGCKTAHAEEIGCTEDDQSIDPTNPDPCTKSGRHIDGNRDHGEKCDTITDHFFCCAPKNPGDPGVLHAGLDKCTKKCGVISGKPCTAPRSTVIPISQSKRYFCCITISGDIPPDSPPAPVSPGITPHPPITVEKFKLRNPLGTVSIPEIIGRVIKGGLGLAGSLLLLMFIFGGFLWITAQGDEKKVKKGWDTLIWSALGIGVILGSYIFVSFFFGALLGNQSATGPSTGAPSGGAPTQPPIPDGSNPGTPTQTQPAPNTPSVGQSLLTQMNTADFSALNLQAVQIDKERGMDKGEVFSDVVSHLPPDKYIIGSTEQHWENRGNDSYVAITHENVHALNKELSIYYTNFYNKYKQAFYVSNGKVMILDEIDGIGKVKDLIADVPASIQNDSPGDLSNSTFGIYYGVVKPIVGVNVLTPGSGKPKVSLGDNMPTALLNEFSAYNISAKAVLEKQTESKYPINKESDIDISVEFIPFALSLAKTITKKDSNYLIREPAFKETLKYLIEDAMTTYTKEKQRYPSSGSFANEVLYKLKSKDDTKELRELAKQLFNTPEDNWTQTHLGF